MAESSIVVEKRIEKGKSHVRRLRKSGRLPGVVYGEVEEPQPIQMDEHEFEMFLKKGHSLITLKLNGSEHRAVIREVQRHPVTSKILHVDFLVVRKGHKINMVIPVRLEGTPKGIKEGGRLYELTTDLNINVLPKDIPDEIVINIEDLGLGDTIRVKDVQLEGVEFLDDPDEVICRIEMPKIAEEEEEEEELEGEEEAAEPEVITSREKEGEEEASGE